MAVTGRLEIRSYEDQDGVKRKAAQVVAENVRFLEKKKDQFDPDDIDTSDIMLEDSPF